MNEKGNRFIIFPEDVEEESNSQIENQEEIKEPSQETESFNQDRIETKNEDLEKKIDFDKTEETSSFVSEEESQKESIEQEETQVSSTDLGELGVIHKDKNGRILFDVESDNSPIFENQSQEEIQNNRLEEEPENDSASINSPVGFDLSGFEEEPSLEEIKDVEETKKQEFKTSQNLQDMINKILKIDELEPVKVEITGNDMSLEEYQKIKEKQSIEQERKQNFQKEIYDIVTETPKKVVFKSNLLEKIQEQGEQTGTPSILARYGEDYGSKEFITNPAIGREEEIKQLILTLLTPEKSAILIGKPGIGKTSIVEGLAYRLQRDMVPEALKRYTIVSIKTPSLIGTFSNGETRLQTLVDELKKLDHVILFIDEIHMLIGATNDSAMDFANMFKEGLGRGQIKIIGATTTEEYERYILRDKAFVRRFQAIDVKEPDREHTIKILMGTIPKIENETGAKMKYTPFIQSEIMGFITDITSEYKRIYGIGSRYPDICLTLLKEAFSQCIFDNRDRVTIFDVRDAIQNSKNIYPDVIRKELPKFDEKFKKIIEEEKADDASIDHL